MSGIIRCGFATRTGLRQRNEDAAYVSAEHGLAALADGMGGAAGGQTASRLAIETSTSFLLQRGGSEFREDRLHRLSQAVDAANRQIFEAAATVSSLRGMGTTLVLLWLHDDRYWVANVGDSRAYRVTDGGIHQLTHDHSLVQERIDAGFITAAEAATQPDRNILTRAVGTTSRVRPHLESGSLAADDLFILTSDGVHGVLTPQQIQQTATAGDPIAASESLVEQALRAGSRDNVTAAILAVHRE